jgi:hypothetical protein
MSRPQRIAWIAGIASQVLYTAWAVASGRPWAALLPLALLVLLLSPQGRRWFRREPSPLVRRALVWGFTAWVLLAAVALGAFLLLRPDPVSGDLGLVHSDRPGLRVLFVGNTLTSDNEMPAMVSDLAEGDPGAPSIFAVRYAQRRSRLSEALEDDQLTELLDDERWFAVVLQEHSQVITRPRERRGDTLPAARSLDEMGHRRGARTVLFQTGAYRDGDPELEADSYSEMQKRVFAAYRNVRGELSTDLAPVGRAWWDAVSRDPLTACVFYAVPDRT